MSEPNPNPNPNPDPNPNPETVTFTDAQKARIDELIKSAMGRAAADTRTQLSEQTRKVAQLEDELKAAKAAAQKSPTPGAQGTVEELQRQIDEMKSARQTTVAEIDGLRKQVTASEARAKQAEDNVLKEKKSNLINTFATKENFVNLRAVSTLTEGNIRWDATNSKWEVLNDEGQPRLNAAYEPMTVSEFFADFAEKNPYLVKGEVKPGSGSGPATVSTPTGRFTVEQIFGKGSNAKLANDLGNQNPAEYKRLKAEARAKGIIA
jgi:hypothetical protein